jgi:hypothetical protein
MAPACLAVAAIAVALWSPVLLWQGQHQWAVFEMSRNLRAEHSNFGDAAVYLPLQLLFAGPWVAPVWLAGLWALLRSARWRPYRAFGVAFLLTQALVLVTIPDRPYYATPLYVVLLAAGAVIVEGVVEGRRRFFADSPPGRRRLWRSARAAVVWVLVWLAGLPVALPILPPRILATVPLQSINYDLGEQVGWPQLTQQVASVYRSLSPQERAGAVIVTGNYGEAGAIDRYGAAYGLPHAYSGHNSFWWWGPPEPSMGVALLVGDWTPEELRPFFRTVSLASHVRSPYGIDNDENGTAIWIARDQVRPWPAVWPAFKHYG